MTETPEQRRAAQAAVAEREAAEQLARTERVERRRARAQLTKEAEINRAMQAMRDGFTPAQACYIGWGLVSPTLVDEVTNAWAVANGAVDATTAQFAPEDVSESVELVMDDRSVATPVESTIKHGAMVAMQTAVCENCDAMIWRYDTEWEHMDTDDVFC